MLGQHIIPELVGAQAPTPKPKQPLDSTLPQSAVTTKYVAATADVTRAKGTKWHNNLSCHTAAQRTIRIGY